MSKHVECIIDTKKSETWIKKLKSTEKSEICILEGKIIKKITIVDMIAPPSIFFEIEDHETYVMFHSEISCEKVSYRELYGDLNWLIGSPVIATEKMHEKYSYGSWIYYKIATLKGSTTICWYDSCNCKCADGVTFNKLKS